MCLLLGVRRAYFVPINDLFLYRTIQKKAGDKTIYCMSPEELVETAQEILNEVRPLLNLNIIDVSFL